MLLYIIDNIVDFVNLSFFIKKHTHKNMEIRKKFESWIYQIASQVRAFIPLMLEAPKKYFQEASSA